MRGIPQKGVQRQLSSSVWQTIADYTTPESPSSGARVELGHRGVLQPRWAQKMHRGGVDFEVESGCAVEFRRMPPPQIHLERCKF